MQFFIFIVEA